MPGQTPEWQELSCANCGAAIDARLVRGAIATCDHCGSQFHVAASLTPQPTLGDLLLGADFRDPAVPGWILSRPETVEFRPGAPAELWASLAASDLIHPVLRTAGPFDDLDASISVRFISGTHNYLSAGFEIRSGDPGDYIIRISAQGTYSVGWHAKTEWGGELVAWASHPALRAHWGDANRLRVVARGDRLRLYFNGVLAASLRDTRFSSGLVRLVVSPGSRGPAVVAFSDLQLREPPP